MNRHVFIGDFLQQQLLYQFKRGTQVWLIYICLTLLSSTAQAQTYRYIGVEDGLSNRRVFYIQKDRTGYMWFLTHEGIDRFDGKNFRFYKLMDGEHQQNSLLNLNWLYLDSQGGLWEIGKRGKIFHYNRNHDRFDLVYKPEQETNDQPEIINHSYIDRSDNIWLCNANHIYLYHIKSSKITEIANPLHLPITSIQQADNNLFYIGTTNGLYQVTLKNNRLDKLPCKALDHLKSVDIEELYYDQNYQKVFIGTFKQGIFVFDCKKGVIITPEHGLTDVSISRIKPLNSDELLFATDGAGILKMNMQTCHIEPYITVDYESYHKMNGSSIADMYIDDEKCIWMANFPIGITIQDNKYDSYNWIKHTIGNEQSLSNDQINDIIEDRDQDLWFATNNGISLYQTKTKKWKTFFKYSINESANYNHIFMTLCEVSPGIIWAGGYSSGIYQINKMTRQVSSLAPSSYSKTTIPRDKYIRDIQKDQQGNIWIGGYYNLKCINPKNRTLNLYKGINSVTSILERNPEQMWVSTAAGLYLVEKGSVNYTHIELPMKSFYIYSLYQNPEGLLYIGTSGLGLIIYNPDNKTIVNLNTQNSALISDNIYSILSGKKEEIILATENGLSCYYPHKKTFQNWTKEQGLMSTHFNAHSGILRHNKYFILGSSNGAIEFHQDVNKNIQYRSKMVFSDFKLFYQTIYPEDSGSPLQKEINETTELKLKYSQNIFSIKVSSINYDCPSDVLYSWKLEGFFDQWTDPSPESVIQFTNLNPGKYKLRVRAISNEDNRVILEERSIDVHIAYPFWLSIWSMLFYISILSLIGYFTIRIIYLKKQHKISDDKIQFFINTAHDIRTPLTLIKAPLEALNEQNKDKLISEEVNNIAIALRNVEALLHITDNLLNFEQMSKYTPILNLSEHELYSFVKEISETYQSYVKVRNITLTFTSNVDYLNVWFDKDKMESIIKNLLSNALKYTPEQGLVTISIHNGRKHWGIQIKDTGIGIPKKEMKKIFNLHFRGSNVINSKITGSGIGLVLVQKFVHMHHGKIKVDSFENQGTDIKVIFPKKLSHPQSSSKKRLPSIFFKELSSKITHNNLPIIHSQGNGIPYILIVEDHNDLNNYLNQILSENYLVKGCNNGKEALEIIKESSPNLIISDIMMPEMDGYELCRIIKNNIETSHIPIILLTVLNQDQDILAGLETGADEYIIKPFKTSLLKAKIINILNNRTLLKNKYANLDLENKEQSTEKTNFAEEMDLKFITSIKDLVEEHMENSDFTIDELCNQIGMSRTAFYTKLKALTGQSPSDYIRLIKLKRAAELLAEGRYNVTEVADMTGFSDIKHFREIFKKQFKVTPSKYNKE